MNIRADITHIAGVDLEVMAGMWPHKSAAEIGRHFLVSRNSIIGIAHRNRKLFPHKDKVRVLSAGDIITASGLWDKGNTLEFIARRFNVSKQTIFRLQDTHPDMFPPRLVTRTPAALSPKQKIRPERAEPQIAFLESVSKTGEKVHLGRTNYDNNRQQYAKSLLDLEKCECKWPMTNESPFMFCAETTDGAAYCRHHTLRAMPADKRAGR